MKTYSYTTALSLLAACLAATVLVTKLVIRNHEKKQSKHLDMLIIGKDTILMQNGNIDFTRLHGKYSIYGHNDTIHDVFIDEVHLEPVHDTIYWISPPINFYLDSGTITSPTQPTTIIFDTIQTSKL